MLKLSLPISRQALVLPLIVLSLSLLVYLFAPYFESGLIYDKNLVNSAELWRLFTAHFVHTNFNHLLLNLAGLTMLWALHGDHYSHLHYFLALLTSALVCALGIYFYSPDIVRYVGLSGVLHGLFVWGAICDIQKGWRSGYLLFIGVWVKVIYEQIYGASADVEVLINANVAIDAHMWGALGGLLFTIVLALFNKVKQNRINTHFST
ncbi:rhombosortase [Thalassotalea aquiviva]|uniref:rhombosortase n=1 Tax=Thalassotalea aquiviva TaxID=3242415 RepID=UPI00352ADD22